MNKFEYTNHKLISQNSCYIIVRQAKLKCKICVREAMLSHQGCILTFLTTLAKFTSCLMYCITYTWFQSCLAAIQIMLVKLQCIILSTSVATEYCHVG